MRAASKSKVCGRDDEGSGDGDAQKFGARGDGYSRSGVEQAIARRISRDAILSSRQTCLSFVWPFATSLDLV